jgi:hypothetical protein
MADVSPQTLSDLEATCVQCRRYSAKKGVRRVSSVLPKWMVGKFLHREFARLQAKITLIHYNFDVCFSLFFCSLSAQIVFDSRPPLDNLKSNANRQQAPLGPAVCRDDGQSALDRRIT